MNESNSIQLIGVINYPDRKGNADYFIFNKNKITNTNLSKILHDNVCNMISIKITLLNKDYKILYCNKGMLELFKEGIVYKFGIDDCKLDEILWNNVNELVKIEIKTYDIVEGI